MNDFTETIFPGDATIIIERLAKALEIRVLVVDDDVDWRQLVSNSLAELDHRYRVDVVSTYEEGFSALRRNEYDVYLIDQELKNDRTGLELVRAGSAFGVRPMIIVTARNDKDLGDEAVARGACDFLIKQYVSPVILDRSIRNSIARAGRIEAMMAERDRFAALALSDPLTGLANRSSLFEQIKMQRAPDVHMAFLYLDLDGFKKINDDFGHSAGDTVLTELAHRLLSVLRPADIVGRIGGDEFVVVLSQFEKDETQISHAAHTVAEKLVSVVAKPYTIIHEGEEHSAAITTSIGIAIDRGENIKTEKLIHDADKAMYVAKTLGKNRHYVAAAQ